MNLMYIYFYLFNTRMSDSSPCNVAFYRDTKSNVHIFIFLECLLVGSL